MTDVMHVFAEVVLCIKSILQNFYLGIHAYLDIGHSLGILKD